MANVFSLNGGPARAPICRRVPQDAPQRRSKTLHHAPRRLQDAPRSPKRHPKRDVGGFLGPNMEIINVKIPARFPILSLSGHWVSKKICFRLKSSVFCSSTAAQNEAPAPPGQIFALSGRWVSSNHRCRRKPTCCPRRPKTSPKHCRTHLDAPRRRQDVQTGK